ncbi:hypothetical protein QFC24_006834 [Naganishia onofrii]|uniref:Uncharacterized protein n=1 Tax=Naganishia onofrii TaxID=1851511 RepID=A0ACC2WWV4_9TREE|nr:hypothetical protein QFC24_006834 [Naganishia onofrii]
MKLEAGGDVQPHKMLELYERLAIAGEAPSDRTLMYAMIKSLPERYGFLAGVVLRNKFLTSNDVYLEFTQEWERIGSPGRGSKDSTTVAALYANKQTATYNKPTDRDPNYNGGTVITASVPPAGLLATERHPIHRFPLPEPAPPIPSGHQPPQAEVQAPRKVNHVIVQRPVTPPAHRDPNHPMRVLIHPVPRRIPPSPVVRPPLDDDIFFPRNANDHARLVRAFRTEILRDWVNDLLQANGLCKSSSYVIFGGFSQK